MRVVTLLGSKGGTGKSTLCLHLAGCAAGEGIRSAILDTDPQGTCANWFRRRESQDDSLRVTKETNPRAYKNRLREFSDAGVQFAVIDTAGAHSEDAQLAASLADLILIPSRPGQADLETISTPLAALSLINKVIPHFVILSISRLSRGTLTRDQEAIETLEALGYRPGAPYGAPTIHERTVFDTAIRLGMTVGEVEPQGKAALETHLLWRWTANQISLK